eukprot:g14450.t1
MRSNGILTCLTASLILTAAPASAVVIAQYDFETTTGNPTGRASLDTEASSTALPIEMGPTDTGDFAVGNLWTGSSGAFLSAVSTVNNLSDALSDGDFVSFTLTGASFDITSVSFDYELNTTSGGNTYSYYVLTDQDGFTNPLPLGGTQSIAGDGSAKSVDVDIDTTASLSGITGSIEFRIVVTDTPGLTQFHGIDNIVVEGTPEPGSFAVLGLAGAMLFWHRRRVEVNISGGRVGERFEVYSGGVVTISGGSVGARFDNESGSDVELIGGGLSGLRAGQTLTLQNGGVLGKNYAVINATLNIQDGIVGEGLETANSVVSISGGNVGEGFYAGLGSQVSISGGNVGNFFDAVSGSTVNISGGSVEWFFEAGSGSVVNLSGGSIGDWFSGNSGSEINITGGTIGENFRSNGIVNLSGGTIDREFEASSGSVVTISGGSVGFRADAESGSEVNITGGCVGLRPGHMLTLQNGGVLGKNYAVVNATLNVEGGVVGEGLETAGSVVNISGGTVGDSAQAFKGSVVNISGGTVGNSFQAKVGSEVNISGGHVGQTMTLQAGGVLGRNFAVVDATLNIEDGVVGFSLEAAGSVVNISGGAVGDEMEAYSGSVINISGGSVGDNLLANSGSEINISGGSVGNNIFAYTGSEVNISGGSVGNEFRAFSGSVVNISGGAVGDDFDAESGKVVRESIRPLAGKDSLMKKRHSSEQIVAKLRQADIELGKGQKVPEVCRGLGISEQTYYRWRTKYGGMDPVMAKQMKEMQKENARLKKLVADQALDIQILKEAYDFVTERTEDGRQLKLLVVLDEFTRECLAIEVSRSFKANEVKLVLQYLFAVRVAPEHIRSDNGSEFVARDIRRWLDQAQVRTLYIQKASPWENGYVESFNGKLRDELLNAFDHLYGLVAEHGLGMFGAEFFAGFGGEEVAEAVGAPGRDIGQFAASLDRAVVGGGGVVVVEGAVGLGGNEKGGMLVCMKQRPAVRDSMALRWALTLCLGLLVVQASAQPNPPGQTAVDQVVQAHRATQSGTVEAEYGVYFCRPDETEFVTSPYRIVFDRPSNRLRVDRPGYTLISDGTDILLTAESLLSRHLRVPLDGALTYERLIGVFPDLGEPTPPVLVYLFSEDPVSHFVSDGGAGPSPLPPTEGQSHLDYPLESGSHKQSFQRETHRLEQLLVDIAVGQPDLEAVRFHYAFEWVDVDKPVDDAEFELDLKQSHEFTTLAAFLSPNGGNAQQNPGAGQGGQGGGVAAGNSLIGMPLPEIELQQLGSDKKVKLSDLDQGVVILECFASWSKTSVLDLPALSDFQAWCKDKEHEVMIYAVAIGEQAENMTKWMDALEKTAKKEIELPVLLDPAFKAGEALKLPTVPRTMIVVDGRAGC